jgi:hypothetical protein
MVVVPVVGGGVVVGVVVGVGVGVTDPPSAQAVKASLSATQFPRDTQLVAAPMQASRLFISA